MPRFVKNPSLVVIVVVSVLLIVLMAFTSGGRGRVSGPESILGQVLAPFQKTLYSFSTSIYNFFYDIGEKRRLAENYQELKKRVVELEQDLIRMNELEKQNQRLRSLLEFATERDELVVTGARVIAKNPGNWFNTIIIDKGENQGVSVNMAVVTQKGLVGRVIEVATNWSKVRTIVDGQSAVSGIIQRNRDNGLVKGNNSLGSEDGMCRMIYLPEDTTIVSGDKVVTSGLGDVFPKGIYIGEVKEVKKEKRELFKTAIIEPGVDFQRLEEVLVVRANREGPYED